MSNVTDAMIAHKKRLVQDVVKLQNEIHQKNRAIKILEKELWKTCKLMFGLGLMMEMIYVQSNVVVVVYTV